MSKDEEMPEELKEIVDQSAALIDRLARWDHKHREDNISVHLKAMGRYYKLTRLLCNLEEFGND